MDKRALSFGLAGLIVILDRITKIWVQNTIDFSTRKPIIPGFFDLIHTENLGMAFGLFNNNQSEWRPFLLVGVTSVVLVFVVVMIWRIPTDARYQQLTAVSLGLILGGALGNLYDRAIRGSVTDFLDFYIGPWHWPAFNVADSAITTGAALLALELLRGSVAAKKAGHAT